MNTFEKEKLNQKKFCRYLTLEEQYKFLKNLAKRSNSVQLKVAMTIIVLMMMMMTMMMIMVMMMVTKMMMAKMRMMMMMMMPGACHTI